MTKHLTLRELLQSGVVIPAISYARVSSEKQLSGEGLRRQTAGTLAWISKHPELRIRLDTELSDAARSAWKGDHVADDGALGKLLRMVKEGELRPPLILLVEALDRLSRQNPWQAQEQLAGLVNRGVIVVTTKDDKIYSLESGIADMILSIVAMSTAHEESELKSGRVRATKAARVAEAQVTKAVLHKNVPGWLRVADAVSTTNRLTRRPEVIERHARTVKTMYEMALHHGAGYITAWLMQNNVEAFGYSGKWNTHYVREILASRATLGHLQTVHGLIEDTLPRIVSDDLWLRVQAACEARKGGGGHKTRAFVNLFAGFSRCTECGGSMRINRNGRTGYRYYECKNHSTFKTCDNRCRYRVDLIEDAVLADLGWLTVGGAPTAMPENIDELLANLATLKAREQRLAARLKALDDDSMFDLVMGQLRELRNEMNDSSTRLSAAQKATAVAAAPVEIADLTDRPKLHTALRQRLQGVCFGEDNTVLVVSTGGAMLLVTARLRNAPPPPVLFIAGADGQMAMVVDGKLTITDALDGMPALDRQTNADLLRRLRRSMAH